MATDEVMNDRLLDLFSSGMRILDEHGERVYLPDEKLDTEGVLWKKEHAEGEFYGVNTYIVFRPAEAGTLHTSDVLVLTEIVEEELQQQRIRQFMIYRDDADGIYKMGWMWKERAEDEEELQVSHGVVDSKPDADIAEKLYQESFASIAAEYLQVAEKLFPPNFDSWQRKGEK